MLQQEKYTLLKDTQRRVLFKRMHNKEGIIIAQSASLPATMLEDHSELKEKEGFLVYKEFKYTFL